MLELTVMGHKMILEPVTEHEDLNSLLAGTPKKLLKLSEEDRVWLDDEPAGKEM